MNFKVFAKRIGEKLSIVLNGKPVLVEPKDKEEMTEMVDLLKKSTNGDEEAFSSLNEKINEKFNEKIPKDEELIKIETIISEKEKEITSISDNISIENNIIKVLEDTGLFEVKKEQTETKYFLKGFKAEMPFQLAEKFYHLILHKNEKEINNLIQFWQLNLLNENKDARRGLYKFLTKQKLMIYDGYFIGFRRIVSVKKKVMQNDGVNQVTSNAQVEGNLLNSSVVEFSNKIKKWKRSKKNYDVYQDSNGNFHLIEKSKIANEGYSFIGNLFELSEKFKNINNDKEVKQKEIEIISHYTDDRTKTMIINIGEPVRIDRSNCDQNPNVECSFGLHIGSADYVKNNKCLGDTIVACLINPMHVISVPYRDAHKMRVCEYFPFKQIRENELHNFELQDISKYIENYKTIEKQELQKAIDVIDTLTLEEKKELDLLVNRKISTREELDQLLDELNSEKENLTKAQNKLKTLFNDDISQTLDLDEIKAIVKSRINS